MVFCYICLSSVSFLTGHFPLNLRSLENGFIFILVGHKAIGAIGLKPVWPFTTSTMNKAAFCQDLFNEITDKIMIGHNPHPIIK